jgi:hypothetical protein
MAKGSSEVLEISTNDLDKIRQSKRSAERAIQSEKMTILGNFVNLARVESDAPNHASSSNGTSCSNCILDSEASTHVTGKWSEFASYAPHPSTHKETIQTADGTYQPDKGVGTCNPSITLLSSYMLYHFQLVWCL